VRLDHLLSKERTAHPFGDSARRYSPGSDRGSYVDHWPVVTLVGSRPPGPPAPDTPDPRGRAPGHPGTTGRRARRCRRHCSVVRELPARTGARCRAPEATRRLPVRALGAGRGAAGLARPLRTQERARASSKNVQSTTLREQHSARRNSQAMKSQRWMPWRQMPMKDVGGCDKPRGAVDRALIRGSPNGETRLGSCPVTPV
jgi:hypothetical protein